MLSLFKTYLNIFWFVSNTDLISLCWFTSNLRCFTLCLFFLSPFDRKVIIHLQKNTNFWCFFSFEKWLLCKWNLCSDNYLLSILCVPLLCICNYVSFAIIYFFQKINILNSFFCKCLICSINHDQSKISLLFQFPLKNRL